MTPDRLPDDVIEKIAAGLTDDYIAGRIAGDDVEAEAQKRVWAACVEHVTLYGSGDPGDPPLGLLNIGALS